MSREQVIDLLLPATGGRQLKLNGRIIAYISIKNKLLEPRLIFVA